MAWTLFVSLLEVAMRQEDSRSSYSNKQHIMQQIIGFIIMQAFVLRICEPAENVLILHSHTHFWKEFKTSRAGFTV